MVTFWIPHEMAVKAWRRAAAQKLTFDDYVLKLIREDTDELRRLQKEQKAKIGKFPRGGRLQNCAE